MADTNLPLSKQVFVTDDCHVLCRPVTAQSSGLQPCSNEEADTRITLHIAHAAQSGYSRVMICTVDTDVVVLAKLYGIIYTWQNCGWPLALVKTTDICQFTVLQCLSVFTTV